MFVIKDERTRLPIKIWLSDAADLETEALNQAINLSNLPFAARHIALMPDVHAGFGMPIGGVLATEEVIIPAAVGYDIGCGMGFIGTDVHISQIKDTSFAHDFIQNVSRVIPVGFEKHLIPQESLLIDDFLGVDGTALFLGKNNDLLGHADAARYQLGTLGGGNHFLELQVDGDGMLGIMVHSGSRNLGKQICDHFNKEAEKLNEQWYSQVPKEYKLAFLPAQHELGRQYLGWMDFALNYAYENRDKMLSEAADVFNLLTIARLGRPATFSNIINCHHNFAAKENHFGKNLYVHRKGATRARLDEIALIPGAMGSHSYIVKGLGNADSFHSCSHGAGRQYSRSKAKQAFAAEDVLADLKNLEIALATPSTESIAEESRFAYKDINQVMANQTDLVKIIETLKTVAVLKG